MFSTFKDLKCVEAVFFVIGQVFFLLFNYKYFIKYAI